MSTTTTQSTLPAKPKASQLITQGNAADFEVSAAEDLLGVMEEVRGKDINAAVPSSINMVTTYLKFSKLKGQPQRRSFMGWTAGFWFCGQCGLLCCVGHDFEIEK